MSSPGPRRETGADVRAAWAAGSLGKKRSGPPEVVFARVHEDAAVEVAALATRERPETAFCIGSGGCTAFSLLTGGLSKLSVIDINPAQVYLLELKKAAFERLPYLDMLRCLTANARPAYPALRPTLTADAAAFWDRRQHLLVLGLNQCGIAERKLNRLMRTFFPLLFGRRRIDALFRCSDLSEQRRFYQTCWDNGRWKLAFRCALSRPALRLVYGSPFVDRVPPGFPLLVKRGVDAVFLNHPIRENGYLWQTFLGRYPPGESGLPIYLQKEHHAVIRNGLARTVLACGDAAGWLEQQAPASLGFFALSNILEVTTPEYAARLVAAVRQAAKPGAAVCIRSIFPPAPGGPCLSPKALTLDAELSEALAGIDRSFFCRFIRVLRVNE